MRELVKFEFKKIINKKLVIIFGIVVIILSIAYHDGYASLDKDRAIAKKYEDKQYTRLEVNDLYENVFANFKKNRKLTEEDEFILDYLWPASSNNEKAIYNILGNEVNYEEIKKNIKTLEEKNIKSTYEYKVFSKAEKMTGKLGELKYMYLGPWAEINSNADISSVLILVMLVIGLAALFSDEYALNTAPILFSTKNGKTKLTIAKVIAGVAYGSIVFASVTGLFFLNIILNGQGESKLPFNLFEDSSPYNLTIGSEYAISAIISFVGIIAFCLFIMILSLILKNAMAVLITAVGVYFLPTILNMITKSSYGVIGLIKNINFKAMFEGTYLFKDFKSFNIFSNVVMKPVVLSVVAIVFIVVAYIVIRQFGKSK